MRIEDSQSILVENSGFYSSTRKNLIEILNSSEVRLHRLSVSFAGQNGVFIAQNSNNIVLDRCDISDNDGNGVHILDSSNIYILHRYSQYNKQDGVRIENAENVNLHDVFLANNHGNGLSILDAFTQGVRVIGCRFSSNQNGVFASAGAGIEIGTAQPREEDVNYFISHDNAGVYLSGVSTDAVIYNNIFGVPYFDTANPHQFGNNHGIILTDHIRDVNIDSNHIVHSKGNGILIQDGASNNKVLRNILHDNQLHGVLVQGSSTLGNVISHNSITRNRGRGIALANGGNSMQKGPEIDTVTWRGESIRGEVNAPDGSVVEVYYDHADQGLHIAGIGNVFRGRFDISGSYDPTMRLNALVITPNGDTSEFTPVELHPDAVDHFFFTSDQGGNRDIYYQGKPNTPPHRITHHSAADYSPHALQNGDGVLFVTEREGNPDIWYYQTRKREFFPLTSESSAEIDPFVEPDAKSFLFAADYAGSMNIYRLPFTSTGAPGSVSYDNGPIDGGRVRTAGYKHGMLIDSPANSGLESVSLFIQNNPAPFAWSLHDWVNNEPGRTALLEGTASPDSTGWHRIDLDGFAVPSRFVIVITMLENGAPILGHAESPPRRGYWLAFENTWEWVNAENLMIRVQFEIDPPQRLSNNNGENRYPAASPNGEEIAFSSFQNDSWDIWIMDRDGSNPRQITSDNSNNTKPVWSSNGQSLLFVSDRNGHSDVYRISKDGANLRRLTEYQGQDIDPVWSLDGERVLFSSDRGAGLEIYRMVNDDIYTDRLTFVTGNANQPHAAPFISSIVYGQRTPQSELSAYTDAINTSAVGLIIDLEPVPPVAKPGDTVEVAIQARDADHLANLALDLRYDPSVLRLISLQPSDSFTWDSMQSINPLSQPSSAGWMRWNWIQPVGLLGDIQVAHVVLEILPEVDDRQTLVYLASSSAFNSSLQAIELTAADARIDIDNGHTSIDHWMLFD